MINSSSLLYAEEHFSCRNYSSGKHAGFKYYTLKKDEALHTYPNNDKNYILFILEGTGNIVYNFQYRTTIMENKMIFLPKLTDFEYTALEDSIILSHEFDKPFDLCDRTTMQSLEPYYNQNNSTQEEWLLDIRDTLRLFLDLLMVYLKTGILCKHLHEIKQKEFFMLLRAFYTREESAAFFAPIISKNIEFKTLVVNQYHNAKTVQELAKLCNYSLATFNRFFTDNFQEAPYQWMQKQKAKLVATRLANKKISLNEIITEFDFSSPAHLTIFCKKYFQMTPSKFRALSDSDKRKNINKGINSQLEWRK